MYLTAISWLWQLLSHFVIKPQKHKQKQLKLNLMSSNKMIENEVTPMKSTTLKLAATATVVTKLLLWSTMDHRSPLENIFSIIGGLPQGHDKPVKHALYNAVALLLLVVSCATCWALYLVLEPFIKPLLWALLVGSVLHPLKYSLRWRFQRWFRDIEESGTPLLLGMCVLPLSIVNYVAELIGSVLWKYLKWIVGVVVAVGVLHVLWFYTPQVVVGVLWKFGGLLWSVTNYFIDGANFYVVSFYAKC